MKWIVTLVKSSMLRWWFIITAVYSMNSTCPCCGNPSCPGGFGAGAILASIFVLIGKAGMMIRDFFRSYARKKSHDWCKVGNCG